MKKAELSLEQADRVREVWGIFLEFTNGTLLTVFRGAIPESLLPYPKPIIEEALTLLEEHWRAEGNTAAADAMASSQSGLVLYVPDSQALNETTKKLSNKEMLESVKQNINNQQKRNLEYLLQNY